MEAGFVPGHESQLISTAKSVIAHQLPNLCCQYEEFFDRSDNYGSADIDLPSSSRTVMSEACHWVRQQINSLSGTPHQ